MAFDRAAWARAKRATDPWFRARENHHNSAIGKLKDDPELLRRAAEYLDEHHGTL